MFGNLGVGELIIIAGIALVILGPEKFPEFAKIAMRAFRDLRGYVDDIKQEMAQELKPVQQEIRKLSQYNPEDYVENLVKAVSAIEDEPEPTEEQTSEDTTPSDAANQNPSPEAPGSAAKNPPAESPERPDE